MVWTQPDISDVTFQEHLAWSVLSEKPEALILKHCTRKSILTQKQCLDHFSMRF